MLGFVLPLGLFFAAYWSLALFSFHPLWCLIPLVASFYYFKPGRGLRAKADHYCCLDGRWMAGQWKWLPGDDFWTQKTGAYFCLALFVLTGWWIRQLSGTEFGNFLGLQTYNLKMIETKGLNHESATPPAHQLDLTKRAFLAAHSLKTSHEQSLQISQGSSAGGSKPVEDVPFVQFRWLNTGLVPLPGKND